MSWIPDDVQAFCATHTLINPTPLNGQWHGFNDAEKKWVLVEHIKSCLTCKHVKTWCHPQTYWEPEDSGYECNHPNNDLMVEMNFTEAPDELEDDEQSAQWYANQCRGYEFFDHEAAQRFADETLARQLRSEQAIAQTYRELGVIN